MNDVKKPSIEGLIKSDSTLTYCSKYKDDQLKILMDEAEQAGNAYAYATIVDYLGEEPVDQILFEHGLVDISNIKRASEDENLELKLSSDSPEDFREKVSQNELEKAGLIDYSDRQITSRFLRRLEDYNGPLLDPPKSKIPGKRLKLKEILDLEDGRAKIIPKEPDSEHDNYLLRGAYEGIENGGFSKALRHGFNAFEIIFILTAIAERKNPYTNFQDETHKNLGGYNWNKLIKGNETVARQGITKISMAFPGGKLHKTPFRESIRHLVSTPSMKKAWEKYLTEYSDAPGSKQIKETFYKLNPYDPSTLLERADSIERIFPEEVAKWKRTLDKPYVHQYKGEKFMGPKYYPPEKIIRKGETKKTFPLWTYAKNVAKYLNS